MKTMTTKLTVAFTSAALLAGAAVGCSVPTSDSVVSGSPASHGEADSAPARFAAQSARNGGVGLPDAIASMAAGQKGTARDLVKKQADKAYETLVKDALTRSLGPTVTKTLGSAFGPLASMATGMIFDQVFGTMPDATQVKLDQIIAAIDNLHADMTARFDSVDVQLNELNRKADAIVTGQAQAAYSKAYQDINKAELPRLEAALSTQRKVAQLLSLPELSDSQVDKLKRLTQDFDSQSHQVALDLSAWSQDIAGVKEGTETPVPGVIAAYQELVSTKRRYLSVYEYQAIKGQALRWQSYSVLAAEVALTGARMEAADGIDEDAHLVSKFVEDGGGAEVIARAIPASNWAPLTADGGIDPNAGYLIDTKTGALVVATPKVNWYPEYTYIQRQLVCNRLSPIPCNVGRTPKWRPPIKGAEDHLKANFMDDYLKVSVPKVVDGSLVGDASKLTVQPFGERPKEDENLIEARKYAVPAAAQFKSYWPTDAVTKEPVPSDASVILRSDGFSYAEGGDRNISEGPTEIWVSTYREKFDVWRPKGSGAEVAKQIAVADYRSRLCGSTESRKSSSKYDTNWLYSTPRTCTQGLDQKPVNSPGNKMAVKPVPVSGVVIWYSPLKPDQLAKSLNLVGVSSLR